MTLSSHIAGSAAVSAAAYAATRSAALACAAFASGVLIDLDHVPDFLILSKEKPTLNNFFSWCMEPRWQRIFIVLHSYELFAILAVIAYLSGNEIILGVLVGSGTHLIMDQLGNRNFKDGTRLSKAFYFLTYRWLAGFHKNGLVKKQ